MLSFTDVIWACTLQKNNNKKTIKLYAIGFIRMPLLTTVTIANIL